VPAPREVRALEQIVFKWNHVVIPFRRVNPL